VPGAGRATRWQGASQETAGKVAPENADQTIGGNAYINGQIKTGVFNSAAAPKYGATFGGIEREFRFFPSGAMMSPTAALTYADNVPRLVMPAGADTIAHMVFEVEEWWYASTIGVYFEWCNDHSAASSPGVLFSCQIREYDIGTQGPADGGLIGSRLTFVPDVPAGKSTTTVVASVQLGNPVVFTPGPFSNFYTLFIQRLGTVDTHPGPIGLICASMTRGQ